MPRWTFPSMAVLFISSALLIYFSGHNFSEIEQYIIFGAFAGSFFSVPLLMRLHTDRKGFKRREWDDVDPIHSKRYRQYEDTRLELLSAIYNNIRSIYAISLLGAVALLPYKIKAPWSSVLESFSPYILCLLLSSWLIISVLVLMRLNLLGSSDFNKNLI